MTTASVLSREKIVSLSELQRNPSKALDASIVRIVKSGKEVGIFMSKEQFEDFVEEHASLRPEFQSELKKSLQKNKKKKVSSLKSIL